MILNKRKRDKLGYELVDAVLYDPTYTVFRDGITEKATLTCYYCKCKDECEAYSKGCCYLLNGKNGSNCPYGYKEIKVSGSIKSEYFYFFIRNAQDLVNSVPYHVERVTKIMGIGEDYIFIPLDFLNNYFNPINRELQMYGAYLLPKEFFNEETIVKLLMYRPVLRNGKPIKSFVYRQLPSFIYQVSKYDPYLYRKLVKKNPQLKELLKTKDHIGEKIMVQALLPGPVEINGIQGKWDGMNIHIPGKYLGFEDFKCKEISITPDERTLVTICDNTVIDEGKLYMFQKNEEELEKIRLKINEEEAELEDINEEYQELKEIETEEEEQRIKDRYKFNH